MLSEEEIQQYPILIEHREKTEDGVFQDEVYNPGGCIGKFTRVVLRCVKCQMVFDIHGDKIPYEFKYGAT